LCVFDNHPDDLVLFSLTFSKAKSFFLSATGIGFWVADSLSGRSLLQLAVAFFHNFFHFLYSQVLSIPCISCEGPRHLPSTPRPSDVVARFVFFSLGPHHTTPHHLVDPFSQCPHPLPAFFPSSGCGVLFFFFFPFSPIHSVISRQHPPVDDHLPEFFSDKDPRTTDLSPPFFVFFTLGFPWAPPLTTCRLFIADSSSTCQSFVLPPVPHDSPSLSFPFVRVVPHRVR